MKNLTETLYRQLQHTASQPETTVEHLHDRPVFLMAPSSDIARIHGDFITQHLNGVVAAVEDNAALGSQIFGVPRWSSAQFLANAAQHPNAIAIDLSLELSSRTTVARLCEAAAISRVDSLVVQAQLNRWAIYEEAGLYRSKTLARLDDFLQFAQRLDDDYSRATLYAHLLARITYDRDHLAATRANPLGEYFSQFADLPTFYMGRREHFVDAGAHQGTIVRKFLSATDGHFASITAFEPDPANFNALTQALPYPLNNFHPINKALSNEPGELRFRAYGTMGSHVAKYGDIVVPTSTLDDEIEQVSFLKMDIEGFEGKALQGAAGLLRQYRPRLAVAVYHAPLDLLDVIEQIDTHAGGGYHYRLRHHYGTYLYDLLLYASPVAGIAAPEWAA